jgi:hypothetical protein
MGGAYPYMDLNAKYGNLYYDMYGLEKLTGVKDKYI